MTATKRVKRPDALTRYYYAKEREESAVLYINDAYLEAVDALEKLEAENARLRELVSILAHCAAGYGCDLCPINGGCGMVGELDMCETVHDCMRELGVEAL